MPKMKMKTEMLSLVLKVRFSYKSFSVEDVIYLTFECLNNNLVKLENFLDTSQTGSKKSFNKTCECVHKVNMHST